MAASLRLTVVTPERQLIDAEADEVQVPGLGGYLGILPGHAPMFSELSVGRLSYTRAGRTRSLAVAGGFVEVLDDQVRVLADVAESEGDIDVARAEDALRRARQAPQGSGDPGEYQQALAAERRALSRLEVAGKKP